MSYYDKNYKILLELYTEVYKELGQDFSKMEKEDGFFMNYEMEEKEQTAIVEGILSKHRMREYQKQQIRNSYMLGCAPKFKKV